jgi:regulator of replication initiation timing
MEISNRLQAIVEKLQQLQQNTQALTAENARLRATNDTLEKQLHAREQQQAAAYHNFSEHAPVESEEQQQDVRAVLDQDIRQQIDHYLSEIDKCIEWLKQQ